MMQSPITELNQRWVLEMARSVQANNEDYYLSCPISYIALQIREFSKFCEENGIDDPSDIKTIIQNVFQPHPAAMKHRDAEYLMHLVTSEGAGSSGKVRAIINFIDNRKD